MVSSRATRPDGQKPPHDERYTRVNFEIPSAEFYRMSMTYIQCDGTQAGSPMRPK